VTLSNALHKFIITGMWRTIADGKVLQRADEVRSLIHKSSTRLL
jgi:hypothetical protein